MYAPCLTNGLMDLNQTSKDVMIGRCNRIDFILITFALKICFLHYVSWIDGWIWIKIAQLYHHGMEKNWSNFGDLGLIFRSDKVNECWEMACLCYIIYWRY